MNIYQIENLHLYRQEVVSNLKVNSIKNQGVILHILAHIDHS